MGHSTKNKKDIIEYDDIVTSSYSFTKEDLIQMYLYSWFMLVFQCFGILNYVTKYFHDEHNMDYETFYNHFVTYCKKHTSSIFGREYNIVTNHAINGLNGQGWDHFDGNLGSINWPIEEASFLRLLQDKDVLKTELFDFISSIKNIDTNTNDLINFQTFMLSYKKNIDKHVNEKFNIDWKKYFIDKILIQLPVKYQYVNKIQKYTDNFDWNTKCIWYGRRKVNYKIKIEEIEYY